VINENLPNHVRSWADFRFLPGVLDALRTLTALKVPLFIITNQAVIGRRLVSRERLEEIHRRMLTEIRRAGGAITDVLYCPHEPHVGCSCRKPEPGMLLTAAERFKIDLRRSVFIGDATTDLLAGQRANCRTILVQTGRGGDALRDLAAGVAAWPTAVAKDLPRATAVIAGLIENSAYLQHSVAPEFAQITHSSKADLQVAVHAAD
jgi:D-glycero-D-manno-heptose 1,7-bisphosphate phosphatase